jgi:hypothetical protein
MRTGALALIATLPMLAFATPSLAGDPIPPPLTNLSLLAFDGDVGWQLETHAEGSLALSSLSLTPPGKDPLAFECGVVQLGVVECAYVQDVPPATSLAELLVDFPEGAWQLLVNGTLQAEVRFYPEDPEGSVTVTSPANGAVGVGTTPSISYTHDCMNCNFIALEYEPVQGGVVLEDLAQGDPPTTPNTVPYGDFTSPDGPTPDALQNGVYELFASAVVASISEQTLASGTPQQQPFEYTTGAGRDTQTSFTVPEPTGAAIAALGALVALSRRTRSVQEI